MKCWLATFAKQEDLGLPDWAFICWF